MQINYEIFHNENFQSSKRLMLAKSITCGICGENFAQTYKTDFLCSRCRDNDTYSEIKNSDYNYDE